MNELITDIKKKEIQGYYIEVYAKRDKYGVNCNAYLTIINKNSNINELYVEIQAMDKDEKIISVTNSGKIFDISDKSVALIIKKYTSLSGLDPNRYSGHSLRSGFATSTAESGAEERHIMAMTGHKTTQMVRRYIQEANLFKNNALNKIKI